MISHNLSILNLERFQSSGSQFGHKISQWRPNILGLPNFVSKKGQFLIFNLRNSFFFLQKAYLILKQMAYRGSVLLYVDSSKFNSLVVKDAATFANIPNVTNLWAGGTLTNFREVVYKVSRRTNRIRRARNKTVRYVSGLYQLDFVPELVVSSSEFYSPFATVEANSLLIPSIAVADSNIISLESTYPALFNDDSFLATKAVFFVFSSSYWFGRADFAMRYMGVTTLIARRLVSTNFSFLNKHSFKKWLRSIRRQSSSSRILKMLAVVGLEPTFSFTRSGF